MVPLERDGGETLYTLSPTNKESEAFIQERGRMGMYYAVDGKIYPMLNGETYIVPVEIY